MKNKTMKSFGLVALFGMTLCMYAPKEASAAVEASGEQPATTLPSDSKAESDTNELLRDADTSITTLMLKVTDKASERVTQLTYTPAPDATDPYQGGELTGHARVPLEGDVYNRSIFPVNGGEHIENFEKGNYGARVNIAFPEGTDAKAMYQTIDWERSNDTLKSDFYIKALGIPTPIHLTWGMTWDQSSVIFNSATPNEFSLVLRGINKDEVSSTEWNKYNPALTAGALELVGAIPGGGVLGNMEGWAEGGLVFDISKYTGNTDDTSKDKVLTRGRLTPVEDRTSEVNISVLDRESLVAGTAGQGDISKALIKEGHEHDNTQTSNSIESWADYLSIWDNEEVYNTNTQEEPEIAGISTALPGESIVNRELITNPGDDFNSFAKDRFNRVINYFTKKDVTGGSVGDINTVNITHYPTVVPIGETRPVVYSGSVVYNDGTTRKLMQNVLNVTNQKQDQQNKITHLDTYSISSSGGWVTGTYEGADVARVKLIVNNTSLGSVPVQNGQIKYYGGNAITSPTQTVQVVLLDASEKVLDTKTLTVTS